jgi:hypothetical protein
LNIKNLSAAPASGKDSSEDFSRAQYAGGPVDNPFLEEEGEAEDEVMGVTGPITNQEEFMKRAASSKPQMLIINKGRIIEGCIGEDPLLVDHNLLSSGSAESGMDPANMSHPDFLGGI